MKQEQVEQLLYQALETELGGVKIYETAIECAVNEGLRQEWQKYLEETDNHVRIVSRLFADLGLDPDHDTHGREIVRHKAQALIQSMEMARFAGDPIAAQLVAAEAVVDAETKDHANWELIGRIAEEAKADMASILQKAYDEVEEQEDMHLYHTMGWARELWIESLGMQAVLPPPEERRKVKTAIGASRAGQAREEMIGKD